MKKVNAVYENAPIPAATYGTPADVPRALEIWRAAVDATHGFLSSADRAEIDFNGRLLTGDDSPRSARMNRTPEAR